MGCKDVNINIVFLDFPNICRVCLNKGEVLKPFGQISSLDVFKNITNIEFESDDNLPQNICNSCINKLEDIATFIDLCKSNDTKLKEIVKKKEIEICLEDTCSSSEFDKVDALIDHSDHIEGNVKSENYTASLKDVTAKAVTVPFSAGTENKKPPGHSTKRQPSSCEVCGENFNTKRKLTEHQKQNDNCKIRQYKCTNCEKSFFTNFRLKLHMRSHTKETPYECKLCGKKFRFAPNLKRHDDIVHKGLKPYKCEICGKEFSRLDRKTVHMNIHTGEHPYVCDYCGKAFTHRSTYRNHVTDHKIANGEIQDLSERKCEICTKVFSSKQSLQSHIEIHIGDKKFLCPICGKGFLYKCYLVNHMRIHTGEKPFECKACGKRFSQASGYKNHVVIHTGERSFSCGFCTKSFKQLGHLTAHLKIHTGEKPYKCNFCGKEFSQNSTLKVHTRIHTGETSYCCPICNRCFDNVHNLKTHKKEHHDLLLTEKWQ